MDTTWFNNGPSGGYVLDLAIAPSDPSVLYAVEPHRGHNAPIAAGTIIKSVDGGLTWAQTGVPPVDPLIVRIDPGNKERVYAGTYRNGVYRTDNGGENWLQTGLPDQRVNDLVVDPDNSLVIYAGTGDYFSGYDGEICGIFKSVDGGASWNLSYDLGDAQIYSVKMHPGNSSVIYAGSSKGFHRSTDAGNSWQSKGIGSSAKILNLSITPVGRNPTSIYAIGSPSVSSHLTLYKSTNYGDAWIGLADSIQNPNKGSLYPFPMLVEPSAPQWLIVGSHWIAGKFIMMRDDDEKKYYGMKPGLPDDFPSAFAFSPETMVAFADGGIYRWNNPADKWDLLETKRLYVTDLAIHPNDPATVFATVSGSNMRLARSEDSGITWDYISESPVSLGAVAIDPQNPKTIYVGNDLATQFGVFIHKSTNNGETWNRNTVYWNYGNYVSRGVSDIWVHPSNSNIILVSVASHTGGGAYRSTDQGSTWGRTFASYSTCLANDPNNPEIVYLGRSLYGYIYKSENSGADWTLISPGGTWVREVRHVTVDSFSHVFVATDSGLVKFDGVQWSMVREGSCNVLAITESLNSTVYYLGTDNGTLISSDLGSTWEEDAGGLGRIAVTAFVEQGGSVLYAGTKYNSVWSRKKAQSIYDSYLTHNTGDFKMSIFYDGSFGHLSSLTTLGEGCQFMNNADALFASGLIFGTQSAGYVNGNQASFDITAEFRNTDPIHEVPSPDTAMDYASKTTYNDNGAMNPYGVSVSQTAFSHAGDAFVILQFGFTSASSLNNFYVGIFADWDVGAGQGYAKNLGGYDQSRNLAYQYVIDGSPDSNYYGIVALDGLAGARVSRDTSGGTIREKALQNISLFENETISGMGDYRTWIGSGPFTLTQGNPNFVYFAFVAGTDLENLQVNADAAAQKYQHIVTDVGDNNDVPAQFSLRQNYPNPFNPSTIIRFALPVQAHVSLTVYNSLGQQVAALVDDFREAGYHEVVFEKAGLASGLYFYRLQAGGFADVKKLLLLR